MFASFAWMFSTSSVEDLLYVISQASEFLSQQIMRKITQYLVKYSKTLSILSIRFDQNNRNGNLGNPARVTINSPSIRPYSVIIMTKSATAFYPLVRFGL